MGCRVISDKERGMSVLYDSVTGLAFGPIFEGSEFAAEEFLDWFYQTHLNDDPRKHDNDELIEFVMEWQASRGDNG